MKPFLFLVGIVLLIGAEIARVYYIMPFPGSQVAETIDLAYFIQSYIWIFRVAGVLMIAYPAYYYIQGDSPTVKWTVVAILLFWVIIVYAFNFRFLADKMFYQPEHKILVKADQNKLNKSKLVIGVSMNGESKAYPIELIGYHHQVRDTVGGAPVMITYCTVCRTGRVFRPWVKGQPENFRLVGMDHFNAMFEDSRTKSWWRQVNGEAIAGPLKGEALEELPSEQMSLGVWLMLHPDSFIMQPDSAFTGQYKGLEKYDEGKMEGHLESHDTLSWKDKSWVIGVSNGTHAKAYDWNDLIKRHVINDKIGDKAIAVVLENDTASFHVWNRIVGNDTVQFEYDASTKMLTEKKSNASWNLSGQCLSGKLAGAKLNAVQAYQEYWHSWRTFHPQTEKFQP